MKIKMEKLTKVKQSKFGYCGSKEEDEDGDESREEQQQKV